MAITKITLVLREMWQNSRLLLLVLGPLSIFISYRRLNSRPGRRHRLLSAFLACLARYGLRAWSNYRVCVQLLALVLDA